MKKTITALAILIACAGLASCTKEKRVNDPGNLVPKTVELDTTLPSITVNGTKLHAETFGNPTHPMVIFLHGGPGEDYRNAMNVKQLADNDYYVVFYDQRGSGLSKRHPKDSYNIQVMFDDLSAVIQHYRSSPAQKVFLFGHSWGAMLAAGYINKYPTAVNGVIFAEPGGFDWEETKEYVEKTRRLKLFNEATNDAVYAEQFLSGDENDHAIIDYKLGLVSPFTYATGNEEGIEGFSPFWRKGTAVNKKLFEIGDKEGFDFRTKLHLFATKVLFLYSEKNKAYGEQKALRLTASFFNVRLYQINGTGHEMIYFGWNKVYPLVLEYLNSLR